ncbi:ABC transporter permease [Leifsonia shinshuensis]|uniref:Putative ABC transport system permease protein n=1 Tax=Leifsonia shinshuensis TaxID=150026 RepID=A0A853CZ89_9MICO|nr:ABC transporter permease [Leifsonia shinshuensis]NYJ25898.1 putative ABC transport system permease protein [Leifsonia shinshuensis]
MNWAETFHSGWAAIRTHSLRSLLTVLGILIGIAAVILTVGLGLGTQKDVSAQISALGSNLLIVSPGSSTTAGGVRGGFGTGSTLTQADATALSSKVAAPDIASVAPVKTLSESLTAGSTNWTTSVSGATPDWLGVRARTMAAGSFFTAADERNSAPVVVLGPTTATELFGYTNVVGQSVDIGSQTFTIVGVLASAGSNSSSNLDDLAVIPLSTAQADLSNQTNAGTVSTIYLEASTPDTLSGAYQEADQILLNDHGITSAASADFTINSQQALVSTATSIYRTLTILLTGIAALSLLVGGIGVMNIMLVSVTERTREIGLRKALGAPQRAIRRQFLVEAGILGLAGGVAGVVLGSLTALVLPGLIGSSVIVSPVAILVSLVVALGIGVGFGVYPASRAARLAPIDALRTE